MSLEDQKDSISFIRTILEMSFQSVINEWAGLTDKERDSLLPIIAEARSYVRQTAYRATLSMVNIKQLTPIHSYLIIRYLLQAKNKAEASERIGKLGLKTIDYKLTVMKPYAENTVDSLEKIYACVTYDDVYTYLQVGKLLKDYSASEHKSDIEQLEVLHDDIASLLAWYRLVALSYQTDDFILKEAVGKVTDADFYGLPDPKIITAVVIKSVDLLEQMKVFPKVAIKSLKESEDLNDFFVTVDAILLNLKNNYKGDQLRIRKRLANMYILQDYLEATNVWLVDY